MLAFIGQFYLSAILGNIYMICWLLWAISEYYCAFFGYIDILPLGLCLIHIVCFDNARILLCLLWPHRYFASLRYFPLGLLCLLGLPLGPLCLLGYIASWAALPLGLLCLLGCFASWATLPLRLLCLLGYLSTLCLLGHVSSTLSALTMPVY
jgi:hypothetical protein